MGNLKKQSKDSGGVQEAPPKPKGRMIKLNRCMRCNRIIKDETADYGPVCAVKMGVSSTRSKERTVKITEGNENEDNTLPFDGDIVFYMKDGKVYTNVPRKIISHSPTGYGWGYLGSGAADFAWNILALFIGKNKAEEGGLYQEFKREVVATYPEAGGTISKGLIRLWLKERGIDSEQKSRRAAQRQAKKASMGKEVVAKGAAIRGVGELVTPDGQSVHQYALFSDDKDS